MAGSWLARVWRGARASVGMLLDGLQELAPAPSPEQMLAQGHALIARVRVELGKAVAASHLASKRIAALQQRLSERAARIEAALGQQREHEARLEVSAQLDDEAELRELQRELTESRALEADLESSLDELLASQAELRRELAAESTVAGDSGHTRAPDPVDSRARQRRIRERLRELRAKRDG